MDIPTETHQLEDLPSSSTDRIMNHTPPPSPIQEMEGLDMGEHSQPIEEGEGINDLGEIHFSNNFERMDGEQHLPSAAPLYNSSNNHHPADHAEDGHRDTHDLTLTENTPPPEGEDQDDNWSVIRMDENEYNYNAPSFNFDRWQWTNDDEDQERRRRITAVREIEQIQRSNFLHFILLCLVPTSLLLILVVTVMGNDNVCMGNDISQCFLEQKSFFQSFYESMYL